MAKIGYIRVSTEEQNLARQEVLMQKCGIKKVFADKQSGKDLHRPAFAEMMKYLRAGDELHVESLSRLSRNMKDLIATMEELDAMGVTLVSHKESISSSGATGRLTASIFAALAQFERDNLKERQREGIEIAKKEGKYKGRSRKPESELMQFALNSWQDRSLSTKQAAKIAGLSPSTFLNRCKELGIEKKPCSKETLNALERWSRNEITSDQAIKFSSVSKATFYKLAKQLGYYPYGDKKQNLKR